MFKTFLKNCVPIKLCRARQARRFVEEMGLHLTDPSREYDLEGSTFDEHCRLSGPVHIHNSHLGRYSYVEPYCRIGNTTVGKFCSIAPFCVIGPPSHPIDHASTHPAFYIRTQKYAYAFVNQTNDASATLRTTIGNDVWIGSNVFIKRGVQIGDGAIIGAGAVVTKDVSAYSIVGGVPAKVIRPRFDQATADRLIQSKWWDRPDVWLKEHAALIPDVKRFLEKAEADFGR